MVAGGLAAAAGLVGGCSGTDQLGVRAGTTAGATSRGPTSNASTVPFRGPRQAGVVTEPQPYAAWVGLDLAPGADRDSARRLLRVWTDDIERLMAARAPVTDLEPELAGVAARLTVTVGVGPGFYAAVGLEADRPEWLAPLPRFPVDRLDPRWGQTDLVVQVCADSPVAVSHARRRLVVGAEPLVRQRWVQRGFREPLTGSREGLPFRNLFGQVDGTVQPAVDGIDDHLVWLGRDAPRGLRGGSSMVVRRIAMDLDRWDAADRRARENAVGRRLSDGAPLTGTSETDPPDLLAKDGLGFPVIDGASHMRRAMPQQPHERILRRPYSYDDPPGPDARTDSGLVFVSFQADPVRQFVPIQRRLAEADLLNIWTTPVGSAVYAVLPGARPGETLGQALLI
ncbi:peroxidase [Intrasporangium oryzae NRRL B-24470]|uniref:Peroxidase n=1 Tax=Intrasporangium oryzae NRRL B-24470 TaxID=1386089 RepID=W9G1W5_9MICO|nr:peroxidase [Intrasporangium oryzae NRRL B-24470]